MWREQVKVYEWGERQRSSVEKEVKGRINGIKCGGRGERQDKWDQVWREQVKVYIVRDAMMMHRDFPYSSYLPEPI